MVVLVPVSAAVEASLQVPVSGHEVRICFGTKSLILDTVVLRADNSQEVLTDTVAMEQYLPLGVAVVGYIATNAGLLPSDPTGARFSLSMNMSNKLSGATIEKAKGTLPRTFHLKYFPREGGSSSWAKHLTVSFTGLGGVVVVTPGLASPSAAAVSMEKLEAGGRIHKATILTPSTVRGKEGGASSMNSVFVVASCFQDVAEVLAAKASTWDGKDSFHMCPSPSKETGSGGLFTGPQMAFPLVHYHAPLLLPDYKKVLKGDLQDLFRVNLRREDIKDSRFHKKAKDSAPPPSASNSRDKESSSGPPLGLLFAVLILVLGIYLLTSH